MSSILLMLFGQIIGLLLSMLICKKLIEKWDKDKIKNEQKQEAETKNGTIYQSGRDTNINE